MASTALPMPQDPQKDVHPFFRPGLNVPRHIRTSSERFEAHREIPPVTNNTCRETPSRCVQDQESSKNPDTTYRSMQSQVDPGLKVALQGAHDKQASARSTIAPPNRQGDEKRTSDRRKRRKLSPPESHSESTTVLDSQSVAQESWLDQLQIAATKPTTAEYETEPASTYNSSQPGDEISDLERAQVGTSRSSLKKHEPDDDTVRVGGQERDYPDLPNPDASTALASSSISAKNTTPKKKVLKINKNGKLLSSPTSQDKTQSPPVKRGRGRKKLSEIEKRQKLVVIKYGLETGLPGRVGPKIEAIFQKTDNKPTLIKGDSSVSGGDSKRPTHPFFLGKPLQRPNAKPEVKDAMTDVTTSEQDNTSTLSGRDLATQISPRNKKYQATSGISFSSNGRSVVAKGTGASTPLWPPKAMVHVRSERPPLPGPFEKTHNHRYRRTNKSKSASVQIAPQEDVLSHTVARMHSTLYSSSAQNLEKGDSFLAPRKVVMSGQQMLDELQSQTEMTGSFKALPKVPHKATQRLQSLFPSQMTPFDLWQYESSAWLTKYAPQAADEVLQSGSEALVLRDWLKALAISAVDDGSHSAHSATNAHGKGGDARRNKRRKRNEDLNDFIVSSEDEEDDMMSIDPLNDELEDLGILKGSKSVMRAGNLSISSSSSKPKHHIGNCIVLSGPHGCGKTASVFAVAKELGYEVFEINAGSRRSAKDVFDRVGDMTQNHLVQGARSTGHDVDQGTDVQNRESVESEIAAGKQGTMGDFFKSKTSTSKKVSKKIKKSSDKVIEEKPARRQKQSMILFEEVDVLFEEDKTFWNGVQALTRQSKRPVVLTCSDENLVPFDELNPQGILRYSSPPVDVAIDHLSTIALSEGHYLNLEDVRHLYEMRHRDFRASINDLSFWCQMGLGSTEAGLDWMIDRWPPGKDRNAQGHPLRTFSCETLTAGLLNRSLRNTACDKNIDPTDRLESQIIENANSPASILLDLVDWDRSGGNETNDSSKPRGMHDTSETDVFYSAKSHLDMLCVPIHDHANLDRIDPGCNRLSSKQRQDHPEGYELLHAGLIPDHTRLGCKIATSYAISAELSLKRDHISNLRARLTKSAHTTTPPRTPQPLSPTSLLTTFSPLRSTQQPIFPPASGWLAPSFDRSPSIITVDLAPYIRSIVAYDQRLEQQRLQLSQASSPSSQQQAGKAKRTRTTRASRAALEGGDKASTRAERWFPGRLDYEKVMRTAGEGWGDVALRYCREEA